MYHLMLFFVQKERTEKIDVSGTIVNKWATGYTGKYSAGEYCYFKLKVNNKTIMVDVSGDTYTSYKIGDSITFKSVTRGEFPVEDTKYLKHYNNSMLFFINVLNVIILFIVICFIGIMFLYWLVTGKNLWNKFE